jgi:hypothetical protein
MPTLQQILEQFSTNFPDKIARVIDDFGDTTKNDFESFITSTYKSIIQEEIDHLQREIDRYTSYMTQMQSKKSYDKGNLAREILKDQINYLQNKLNEIE